MALILRVIFKTIAFIIHSPYNLMKLLHFLAGFVTANMVIDYGKYSKKASPTN